MSTPDYVSYVFVWHSLSDACPKCQRLNGREWRDQDLFQNVLWDPLEGAIWDLDADHSLAHGHGGQHNCRCQLEVQAEVGMAEVDEYNDLWAMLEEFGY